MESRPWWLIRLRILRLRVRHLYRLATWHPDRWHPDSLTSHDGEPPYFLRRDLALDQREAAYAIAADYGYTGIASFGDGMDPVDEIELVWMTPHVGVPCRDEDWCEDPDCLAHGEEGRYDVVDQGTPGAIPYWRWGW